MKTKRNRRPIIKFTTRDTNFFIHPYISYRLSDERRELIDRVNHYYRLGLNFKTIGEAINKSETTARRMYFGYADNCLSSKQLEELEQLPNSTIHWTKTVTRIAAEGESPTRSNVRQPIITSTTIHYFDEDELTASMPLPFEIWTTKFIPSSIDCDFGNQEHQTFEYVDVVDVEITKSTLKPYCVIYCGACCTI